MNKQHQWGCTIGLKQSITGDQCGNILYLTDIYFLMVKKIKFKQVFLCVGFLEIGYWVVASSLQCCLASLATRSRGHVQVPSSTWTYYNSFDYPYDIYINWPWDRSLNVTGDKALITNSFKFLFFFQKSFLFEIGQKDVLQKPLHKC